MGANASGKSTLIVAMSAMRQLILRSFVTAGDELGPMQLFVPHRLGGAVNTSSPIDMEVTCLIKGVRYRYGFLVQDGRVLQEILTDWPKGQPRDLLRRDGGKFNFSPSISGGEDRAVFVSQQTRPEALFLSTAQKLNHPAVGAFHDWVQHQWQLIDHTLPLSSSFTSRNALEKPEQLAWANQLMRWADLGIESLAVSPKPQPGIPELFLDSDDGHFKIKSSAGHEVIARHRDADGQLVAFDMEDDESHGTQRLYAFAGPIWDVLKHGRTLCVDEINTGMHHWLIRRLVQLFQDKRTNPHGAQLVFTSHDPLLLDLTLLRRDQIGFVKKDSAGASELYSLSDFSTTEGRTRKDTVQLHKRYLSGDYGAIPALGSLEELARLLHGDKAQP
jgi:uncharacterized protein